LKSLDSYERIQGNPTRPNRGFHGEKAAGQENPNGSTRALSRRSRTKSIPMQRAP
jgi:hypothetical protein